MNFKKAYGHICEEAETGFAEIFFLPVDSRPDSLPPVPGGIMGGYWHTGIIYKGNVYETFGMSHRHSVRKLISEDVRKMLDKAVIRWFPINTRKLLYELNSGTDCATYVARVIGLDTETENDQKGDYWPEDILKHIDKQHNSSSRVSPMTSMRTIISVDNMKDGSNMVTFIRNDHRYGYVTDMYIGDIEKLRNETYYMKPNMFWNHVQKHPEQFRRVS